MNIPIFDGAALEYLRQSLSAPRNKSEAKQQKKFCEAFRRETNEELLALLAAGGHKDPIKRGRITCDGLDLDPNASEITNVLEIRSKLSGLTPAEASSEKLWAGLCIAEAWNYVRDRWGIKDKPESGRIKEHYMFAQGRRRSLTRNGLSRLWWIGQLTVDEGNANDPYHNTRFLLEKLDQIVAVLERNTSDNKAITFEIVEGIRQAREAGYQVERYEIRELSKYINIVGGVDILDMLPAGAITRKWIDRAKKICPRLNTPQDDSLGTK